VPGTFTATDAGVPQTVVDDGNGNIVDAAAPATIVGTIDYESGLIDFTWPVAFVGPAVTAGYNHRGWLSFTAPITGTLAVGGGMASLIAIPPVAAGAADNYADGIKGNTYIGIMMHSPGNGSMVNVVGEHQGMDTNYKLVPPPRFRNLNSPLTEEP
jgi:hypothetical protein